MVNLTVIVPTVGRTSLIQCLNSFADDLAANDQVIIIRDGFGADTQRLTTEYADLYPETDWLYLEHERTADFGHPLRNHVLDNHVENEWVWSIDDDDEATVSALTYIRTTIEPPWGMYKMHYGPGHRASGITLWNQKRVWYGNIGTPMIVAPANSLARWGTGYDGDYQYAQNLRDELGEPNWYEQTVALIRP